MSDPFDTTQGAAAAAPPPAAADPFATVQPPPPSTGQVLADPSTWKRQLALVGRNIATGVSYPATMAMDAGVATRNLLGDLGSRISVRGEPLVEPSPDYELPSSMLKHSLTEAGLPEPANAGEKVASFVESGLTAGAVPGGGAPSEGLTNFFGLKAGAPATPSNFVGPAATKAQMTGELLSRVQDSDFVIPPSTTNPTLSNRLLESVAGKENTQNFARLANDKARTNVAARALGLNPDAPLTQGAVQAVKEQAGKAYDVGRSIPQFPTDDQYLQDLVSVLKEHAGANESFPGAANPDLEKLVDTYTQGAMTGNAGISAIKLLRDKASDAFTQGNSEMGRAYKGISAAIENQLERAVQNPSLGVPANTISQLRQARQLYAKASLVGDSMAPDGTILGPKLAAAWRADEPITGELRDAAEFAAQYPKANLSASASGSPVNHLSTWGALLGAGLGEHVGSSMHHGSLGTAALGIAGAAALPAARMGARAYLLGPGQSRALPAAMSDASPAGWRILTRPSPQQLAAGLSASTAGQ